MDFGRVMVKHQQEYKCRQHSNAIIENMLAVWNSNYDFPPPHTGYLIITFPNFDKLEQKDMRISNQTEQLKSLCCIQATLNTR